MRNRDGWDVDLVTIEEVIEDNSGGVTVRTNAGWWLGFSAEEISEYTPQVNDVAVVYTRNLSMVHGFVIDDHVIRYKDATQVDAERQEWLDNYEREKEANYQANKDKWQEEVNNLHPTLQKRIRRFEAEKGSYEFWKEDGGYELHALKGATALLNWADSVAGTYEDKLQYLDYWNSLNTAEHDYDYEKQKELVPDFGDGHSGWTASSAFGMARAIITGEYTE